MITEFNLDASNMNIGDAKIGLKEMKNLSPEKIIIGHLNINSIRYKIDQLSFTIGNNIDILLISETKLDNSFPSAQFTLQNFKIPYRYDRTDRGGGLLLYVRKDIPSKFISVRSLHDIEILVIEINLRKRKWALLGSYNPHRSNIKYHVECLNRILDEISTQYDNYIVFGDFNVSVEEDSMDQFCNLNDLKNLITQPTCYKNFDNPTSIDLILTNKPTYFQNSKVFETGISDFHLLTVTELKMSFQKLKPKIITYRDYKKFNNDTFRSELTNYSTSDNNLYIFLISSFNTFNKYAPIKRKYVRANEAPFMNKELHKAIMKRSRLKNKYLKNKTELNRINYKTQRNLCKKNLIKTKRSYFNNLNTSSIIDNRAFWKTIRPFFTEKASKGDQIILNDSEKIISLDEELCETFNGYFKNIVTELEIQTVSNLNIKQPVCFSSIAPILKEFESHPSISNIKNKQISSEFSFRKVSEDEVQRVIYDLDTTKGCQNSDIPTKIIKNNGDIYAHYFCIYFNESIETGIFPDELKNADIIPVYKKKDKCLKENYRPVSILSNISKIFEKLIYNQLYEYFEAFLFPSQCGFRKGFNAQHCLLVMLEKFKDVLDQGDKFGALLTDLSKAFDCLDHTLLIAKLHYYGVLPESNTLILSYLTSRTQRVKINDCFSEKSLIKFGVPQGSVLGPLLFNIYLIDLFSMCEGSNIVSYADDTTPYAYAKEFPEVISQLQLTSTKIFDWFKDNHFKVNPGKSHLLLSSNKQIEVTIGDKDIKTSTSETLLGIIIDSELKFEEHTSYICKKATQKLNALARIATLMNFQKRRTIFKAFIDSQFNYCPLIWMFHSRRMNNRVNRIHERALRLVYSNYTSSFEELLDIDGSYSIHHRNIQALAVEIYKFFNGLSPDIMSNIFKTKSVSYNLRSLNELYSRNPKSVRYGTESISYLAPKIWSLVPESIKISDTLNIFKSKIKKWKPNCPCRLCKTYLQNVGFI